MNPRLVERLFGKVGCTLSPDRRASIAKVIPEVEHEDPKEAYRIARQMATANVDARMGANAIRAVGIGAGVLTVVTIGWEVYNRHQGHAVKVMEEPKYKPQGEGAIMKHLKAWGLVDK